MLVEAGLSATLIGRGLMERTDSGRCEGVVEPIRETGVVADAVVGGTAEVGVVGKTTGLRIGSLEPAFSAEFAVGVVCDALALPIIACMRSRLTIGLL